MFSPTYLFIIFGLIFSSLHTQSMAICVSCIPVKSSGIKSNRIKVSSDSAEGKYRLAHALDIQNQRYNWYKNNTDTFVNLLRETGHSDSDIQSMYDKKKPLGFKSTSGFNTFKRTINDAVQEIYRTTPVRNIKIILQGSNIVGYSSNPRKGSRYIPDYIYDSSAGSDMDIRIYGDNIDQYVQSLKNQGVDIQFKKGGGREYILEPDVITKIFPQFKKLLNNYNLQITGYTKKLNFSAKPWDMAIN